MKTVSLTIDGKKIKSRHGENILWAALDNDIYIPNLCAIHESSKPFAGCRLCFVEIAGYDMPVTACTETVKEGMIVNTQGAKARRLARTSFELIMTSHPLDCANCLRNGDCELHKIAGHLNMKVKSNRLRRVDREMPVDDSSPIFSYDPNKCVLCGRCVWICRDHLGIGVLGFSRRGFERKVSTFENMPIAESKCQGCGDCVEVCPAGALTFKHSIEV